NGRSPDGSPAYRLPPRSSTVRRPARPRSPGRAAGVRAPARHDHSLELPPGSPLSRAALAGQFGVSSTPIRDALMRLEEEGLVEVYPQHATVVSRIDVERAQQAHFLRQSLELEIVRLLALDRGDQLIDELTRAIA